MPDPLATEIAYFNAQRPLLLQHHAGKFVLIKGEELIGSFDMAETAFNEGARRFGLDGFLMKQVVPVEPPATSPALYAGLLVSRA